MLIALISDTHLPRGGRQLPDDCRTRLEAADMILHAGDVISASSLAEIELIGPPVAAVRGNQDDADLGGLPLERTVEVAGSRIGMVHDAGPAAGRLRRMRGRFPNADAVVFGHSHLPLHEQDDGFQIFNPGSPTDKRRAPAYTMGLAQVRDGAISFELVEVG